MASPKPNFAIYSQVYITGLTVESTKECGVTTKWRAPVFSSGPTVASTKETTLTIRRKVTGRSTGEFHFVFITKFVD